MAKIRQDAWSHEDDLLLAETVLRHIREGSTQLRAFDEVGDKLNRTSAACGFRWNAEVRNKYNDAIDLSKRQRKERKRAFANNTTQTMIPLTQNATKNYTEENTSLAIEERVEETPITMDAVIQFLKQAKKDYHASNQSKSALYQLEKENADLKNHIGELERTLSETEKQLATIQEDYQVFIQIMDRARKMTVLDDQGSMKAPAFRMDKNGNLEQLAQGSGQ